MNMITKIIPFLVFGLSFADYEYSVQDYNPSSPTYGLNVWQPEYSNYITIHFFSSQG
jgi:hypothetical protein